MFTKRYIEINDEWKMDFDNGKLYNIHTGESVRDPKKQKEIIRKEIDRNKAYKTKLKMAINKIDNNNNNNDKYCFKWNNKCTFTKIYRKEFNQYNENVKLSPNAATILLYFQGYIEFTTNQVIKKNKQNFSNQDIAKLTGLSLRTITRSLKELEDKHFIKRIGSTKNREIYVNPYLISVGNTIQKSTVDMFQDYYQS